MTIPLPILPVQWVAPIQTLVNFHASNGKLSAFRQFDASGYLIYEACKGEYQGKKVDIGLEEDDLYGAEKPGLYLHPQ